MKEDWVLCIRLGFIVVVERVGVGVGTYLA